MSLQLHRCCLKFSMWRGEETAECWVVQWLMEVGPHPHTDDKVTSHLSPLTYTDTLVAQGLYFLTWDIPPLYHQQERMMGKFSLHFWTNWTILQKGFKKGLEIYLPTFSYFVPFPLILVSIIIWIQRLWLYCTVPVYSVSVSVLQLIGKVCY